MHTNLLASYVRCTQGLSGVSDGPSAYYVTTHEKVAGKVVKLTTFYRSGLFPLKAVFFFQLEYFGG